MELQIKPYTMPKVIEANFDELKTALEEKVKEYELSVYSPEQIKQAKEDKASLNRLKKALNDERIRREKEYMVPFTEFKAKVNEIIGIIDRPIAAIDAQLTAYEEKRKEDKEAWIKRELFAYVLPYEIDPALIWNARWLNATFSEKDIIAEITERVRSIIEDVKTIDGLNEDRDLALVSYKKDLDLRHALAEATRARTIREEMKKVAEQRKAQEAKPEPKPEVKAEPVPEVKQEVKQEAQWVNFSALLTVDTARLLKRFFEENGIEYKAI